jgi:lipoate synthase
VGPSSGAHLAAARELRARHLGLRHVVITSVTRDDLDDGGNTQ